MEADELHGFRELMDRCVQSDWGSCVEVGLSLVWGRHGIVDVSAGAALIKAAAAVGYPAAARELDTLPPFAKITIGHTQRDKSRVVERARAGDVGAILQIYYDESYKVSKTELHSLLDLASQNGSVTADALLSKTQEYR